MALTTHVLAAGKGWRVLDAICTSGPDDRPFEEQHRQVSIAAVVSGTFQYRTRQGSATLVPGSLLTGNAGACFRCGHEHGAGDRCIAFHLTPEFLESVIADVPGARQTTFDTAGLPPLPQLLPLVAAAEIARDERDSDALEELTVRFAGAVSALSLRSRPTARRPSARDERRISAAVRRIEASAHEPLTLSALAREAGVSPYHFLRTFTQVTGMTPHQYVLRTRLHRAAVRLRRTGDAITTIAYEAGFNDLSSFNRRFRRLIGVSPGLYRAQAIARPARARARSAPSETR